MAITNQNDAQTIARIEDLKGDLALNFKQICELLVLVGNHYLHRDPLFRSYREVASGKLMAEAVMAMAAKRGYLAHIAGRPRDVQLEIARDGEFDWCCEVKGEIVTKRTGWKKMGMADFKRMFPIGGGVRSVQEQRAIIQQEIAAGPVTHIRRQPTARIDVSAQTFTLGSQTVPLSVVVSAMRDAGMSAPMLSVARIDGMG
jgi:hypothetical protein